MELKKSICADLQNKRKVFFLCGLIVSILFVVALFSWSKSEIAISELTDTRAVLDNEVIIAVSHEEPKKIEPKIDVPTLTDALVVVENNILVNTNMNIFDPEANTNTAVVIKKFDQQPEIVSSDDAPVIKVEKMPKFQGGDIVKFRSWVLERLIYPAIATENNISGKVVLSFIVEIDGSISGIKVLASPDSSLSDEAIRVVAKSPKWEAGSQRGKPVRVIVNLPIDFTLK